MKILILLLAVLGASGSHAGVAGEIVARVGNATLTTSGVACNDAMATFAARQSGSSHEEACRKQAQEAVNQFVIHKLVELAAARLGVVVEEKDYAPMLEKLRPEALEGARKERAITEAILAVREGKQTVSEIKEHLIARKIATEPEIDYDLSLMPTRADALEFLKILSDASAITSLRATLRFEALVNGVRARLQAMEEATAGEIAAELARQVSVSESYELPDLERILTWSPEFLPLTPISFE